MAEIAKVDGLYYYAGDKYDNIEEVYKRFRKEYNAAQGRSAYLFLQRIGQRKERVHGSSIVYSKDTVFGTYPETRIQAYMLGLVCGSYCKMVGIWDIPYEIDDDWIDWIFRYGGKELKIVGKRQKTGRTSKKRKRYR